MNDRLARYGPAVSALGAVLASIAAAVLSADRFATATHWVESITLAAGLAAACGGAWLTWARSRGPRP